MNSDPYTDPWNLPPIGVKARNLCRRAAAITWLIGAVQAVFFGTCTAVTAWAALLPLDQLRRVTSHEQFEQFSNIRPMLGAAVVTVGVLGFVPGVAYVILGFGVRRGHTAATRVVLVLATTQVIVFGTVFVHNVLTAIRTRNPTVLTFNAATLGSLLVLLGLAIRRLWFVSRFCRDQLETHTDPWNNPPT